MANLLTNINQVCSDLTNIKNTIIEYGVPIETGTPSSDYAKKIDDVYNSGVAYADEVITETNSGLEAVLYGTGEGGKSWYDRFWDNFQQNGTRRNYWGAFSGAGWNDEIFNPKYPLDNLADATYLFYRTGITIAPAFSITSTSLASAFARATALKWVEGITISKEVLGTGNLFVEASSLVHCPIAKTGDGAIAGSVDASVCPFDRETIESWVNVLSDTKTGLTITFNLAAVNKAFETAEGANNGSTTVEWNTLQNSKSNWTISLV